MNEICKELEQCMRKITNGCEIPTKQKQEGMEIERNSERERERDTYNYSFYSLNFFER